MKDHANEALSLLTGKRLRKQIRLIQQCVYTRCFPLIPSHTFPNQMVGDALTLLLQSQVWHGGVAKNRLIITMNTR